LGGRKREWKEGLKDGNCSGRGLQIGPKEKVLVVSKEITILRPYAVNREGKGGGVLIGWGLLICKKKQ